MLIVDAHEDIAWNRFTFSRDYTQSALWLREKEANTPVPSQNGNTLLSKSDWLLGHVGLIFSTLFVAPARHKLGAWDTQVYATAREAYRIASSQLDFYHRLVDEQQQFRLVGTRSDLEQVVTSWSDELSLSDRLIGLVPLMEGADPIIEPEQVEEWFERGLRVVGLAWESTRYAGGTHEPGALTSEGRRLLDAMASFGMMLDVSHLAEQSYYEAIDYYPGPVIASHANPRYFVPTTRGLSDDMIGLLAERDGVIGIVLFNAFLKPNWHRGDLKRSVNLSRVADAIDYVCQKTGNTRHVGIGSDFDGGFGVEHTPAEVDTVADLPKLGELLGQRGYTPNQISDILGGNWLRILRASLPA